MNLRPKEAAKHCGVSRTKLYELMSEPGFPRPVKLGPRITLFRTADLDAWMEAKVKQQAAADQEAPRKALRQVITAGAEA